MLSSLTSLAADLVQQASDIALNKSELEKKLDEALSTKNWAASTTQLRELASATNYQCGWRADGGEGGGGAQNAAPARARPLAHP